MPPKTKKKSSATSSISDDEMMIEDSIQRIVDLGKEGENKILRIMERYQGESSSNQGSSGLSSKAKDSNERDQKFIYKISEAIRKHASITAVRLQNMLGEVTRLKTLMIKAKVQQLFFTQTQDPLAFLSTIGNPDLPAQEYGQWTEYDHLGYYILSHFYIYGFYLQPLTQAGKEREYWNAMTNEILQSVTNTPVLRSFDEFVRKHADDFQNFGISPDELYSEVKSKFRTELYALYNLLIALPVKVQFGTQMQSFGFPEAYVLLREFLSTSGFMSQEQAVRRQMQELQHQIAAVTGIQPQSYAGGSLRRVGRPHATAFSFPRYVKLGKKKSQFL